MTDGPTGAPAGRLDPITFEILRHRLWAINEEAATTLKLVSGSTVATEANDMNTAIMNAQGEVTVVARYSLAKATTMSLVVLDIAENYADNPGIRSGDGFLCNDVYLGVQHQNDIAFVMPWFFEGEVVAWVGAEVHQIDVGGPVPGSVQVGAKDIYGEAPLIPPIRIVENDTLRADLERNYLRRSRLPDLMALDLRAKWAACNVARERLTQVARQYGIETVKQALDDTLNYVETKFRARLKELPDGTWRHVTYMDYDDIVYPIRIAMTKRGDELRFDFTGTAAQAPATVNCTRSSLVAVLLGYVCISLGWDFPWSPSAIGRAVEVVSEPGTVVDCAWPAGVSKSTTSISWSVGKASGLLIGRMLACSDKTRNKAMASWQGSMLGEDMYCKDASGNTIAGTVIDSMAGAGGARTFKDGIDTGGYLGSMGCSVANVETYEMEFPILYLYRSQQMDGGGAGTFRGGVSLRKAYTVDGVDEIGEFVMHCVGVKMPLSPGMYGGYTAGTNQLMIKRGTNVWQHLAASHVPGDIDQLEGEIEVHQGTARSHLKRGDVFASVVMGGGGYGDPLDRDSNLVAKDVAAALVSAESARDIYGVVIGPEGVDEAATKSLRDNRRRRRLAEATQDHPSPPTPNDTTEVARLGHRLVLLEGREGRYLGCSCGHVLAPAAENYKAWSAEARRPLQAQGPQCDPFELGKERFEVREYYCPGCGGMLEADMLETGEPVLWDLELA
ncbi:MAG: hydantoinase B/oxoprolinase family protein [Rhodospirillales bacterium]|nr:hydantoinase B/oxoprolinase family protein [Rhodospirillales bacterium]HJO72448.1 hydantoinase B/oxoprolinase family protein [Rhodospirillales bacterium]